MKLILEFCFSQFGCESAEDCQGSKASIGGWILCCDWSTDYGRGKTGRIGQSKPKFWKSSAFLSLNGVIVQALHQAKGCS